MLHLQYQCIHHQFPLGMYFSSKLLVVIEHVLTLRNLGQRLAWRQHMSQQQWQVECITI